MKTLLTAAIVSLASIQSLQAAEERVIPLEQLASEVDIYEFFQHGWDESIILQVPKGSSVPLQLFLTGEVATLRKEGDGKWFLDVQKTFYVRHHKGEGFLFSLDGQEWAPLMSWITGNINAGLQSDETGPLFQLGGVVNLRQ